MANETGNLNPLEPGIGLMPSPATDVMGNQTPAAMARPTGADTLASPNQAGEGELPLAPPSGGASILDSLRAKNSPFLKSLAQGTDAASKILGPAAAAPGGWARSVLAGTMHAISGGVSSLSDAAAAGQPAPGGGGALTGVARTVAARNQRMQQQLQNQREVDKNKVLMAEANTRMIHEQGLIHKMGEDEINQSIATGTQAANKLKTAASPAPVIAEDLTSDELKQYLKDNKIDPTKETAFPTGRRQVGTKPDGTADYRTTYTAMGVPPEVRLDPENPEDKKILDDMNKYAPPNQGKWSAAGTQTMTGQQFNWVQQQVADNKAATMARNKTLIDQKLAEKEDVRKMEAVTFGGSDWTNALANAPNHDPIAARNAILGNPQLAAKYPNLDSDLRYQYGEKNYDKMLDDYQKKVDTGKDEATDLQKALDKAHGEEAASIAQGLQAKIDDPNTPAPLKNTYQRMMVQANNQAKASAKYSTDLKANEADAEQKASQGDLSSIMDMVKNYDYDPDKLFSRFKGMKQKQEFIAELHRQDPTWSEANYRARFKTKQDFTAEGKGGLAVQSLNTFAGHVGDANSLISTLQNTRSPLLNRPLNAIKVQLGNDKVGPYQAALMAARKEYENFLNNQHASHEIDEDQMNRLLSENTSPAAAQAILRQMAHTVAIRARSLNSNYRNTMQSDIPNFLDPDTQQVLNSFNIDPKAITAQTTSGLVKNPQAPKTVPAGARPIMKNGQPIGYIDQNGKRVDF